MTNQLTPARIVVIPSVYAGWAVLVVAALLSAYVTDPYVFGFTAIVLGWLSLIVSAAGLSVVLFSSATGSAKAAILVSILAAGAAVITAFAELSTFKWA